MNRGMYWACGAVLALTGLLFWLLSGPATDEHPADSLRRAKIALARGEYQAAVSIAAAISESESEFAAARLVTGEALTRLGKLSEAADEYRAVKLDGSEAALKARFALGNVLLHSCQLSEAEAAFRDVLQQDPGNVAVHSRLAFLLGAAGRRWESKPHFVAVLRSGQATVQELGLLGDIERPVEEGDFLKKCFAENPTDTLVQLGLAADAYHQGETAAARKQLRQIVETHPELLAAQVLLGQILVDTQTAQFCEWNSQLSPTANQWPEIWYIRGLHARNLGQPRMAARCFWQALRLDPMHGRSNYHLGRVLGELDESAADEFAERSRQLHDLSRWFAHALKADGGSAEVLQQIVNALEELGRIWEASAWAHLASQRFPDAEWPSPVLQRLWPRLQPDLPLVTAEQNADRIVDLADYPEFRCQSATGRPDSAEQLPRATTGIRFQEEADCGLDIVYVNGEMDVRPGARMQEQFGGGVSVLDLDADLWPDLYFVQGGIWQHDSQAFVENPEFIDRVYRNLRGTGFADVTAATEIYEPGFGQSCAVGDLNEDGFPDLYIANIGRNRIYLNNGDGTFRLASTAMPQSMDRWTSSAAIADLTGDGWTDIFDANYVTGPDVYSRLCNGRGCSPSAFTGIPDQLHISAGDGSFKTMETTTPVADSKGMGVLVAGLAGTDDLSVFIANDQVPNFLLVPSVAADGQSFALQDIGFQSGLAYNQDGLLLAGMGVATDDVDHNGLLDVYVTNFQNESNTLYMQVTPGFFHDMTRAADLQTPSLPFVGWGTQFLDADRDSESDLVVANGHVEDYRDKGDGYQMRTQFYQNLGQTRFAELHADQAGAFFARPLLGRGLARLDWNRDGLMEFVVSTIGERPALTTNQTTAAGHFLNLRLIATTTARDAVGATAEIRFGDQQRTMQVVAGDGYHAANQQVLQFGLGPATVVDEVRISWPSGQQQVFTQVPVDTDLTVVEGRPAISGLTHGQPGRLNGMTEAEN